MNRGECSDGDTCRNCGAELPSTHEDFGKHYGYPPCCVYEFIEWADAVDLFNVLGHSMYDYHPRRDRMLAGSGFIPCAHHHLTLSDVEMIALIQSTRECSLGFIEYLGQQGWMEDVQVSEQYL